MQNSNGEVTASSLLEDLKNSDSKIKVNAIKSLKVIAFALGKERTRNELLPFLTGK
jgi:serine/threonine-protein phosphatase 2A regulatory subunit A